MANSPAQNLSTVALYVKSTASAFNVTTSGATQLSVDNLGNLIMNSTASSFEADFSNANPLLRAFITTTTYNGNALIGTHPNSGGTVSSFLAYSNSNVLSSSFATLESNQSNVRLASDRSDNSPYLPLVFQTSGTENMRLDINGNLGIGTSQPVFKLDVTGSMRATGNITVGGNVNLGGAINFSDGSSITTGALGTSVFDYTGNGSTTTFATGNYSATSVVNTNVYLQGVYQRKNTYSWVGSSIIFNSPPPLGTAIEIVISNLSTTTVIPAAGSVTPGSLSTGGPSWDATGNLIAGGGMTAGGNVSTVSGGIFGGNLGIGTTALPPYAMSIFKTDAALLPVGSTAQRPAAATGLLRFNSSLGYFEGYNGTQWGGLGGATGGGTDQTFWTNGNTITANYTVPSGYNSGTFGPITINPGVTVTVSSGSYWSIV